MKHVPARAAIGAVVAIIAFVVLQRTRGMGAFYANIIAVAIGVLTYSLLATVARLIALFRQRKQPRRWPPD